MIAPRLISSYNNLLRRLNDPRVVIPANAGNTGTYARFATGPLYAGARALRTGIDDDDEWTPKPSGVFWPINTS